jgi:hypothetical protein
MSGFRARFVLLSGALAALLCTSAPAHAEGPAARRGSRSLVRLTAWRETLAPGSARNWGLSYPIDEMYAGPWAYSPFASPSHTFARDTGAPPERTPGASTPGSNRSPADSPYNAQGLLSRLGPVGLLASIVIPAAAVSSGAMGRVGEGVTARVGFAKMAGGYGVVVSGRFY